MTSTDLESLEPTVRNRNKCLYVSLTCLALAVVVISLGGAAMSIVAWRELQLLNDRIDFPCTQSKDNLNPVDSASRTEERRFKSGHLAYLRATKGEIHNHTMPWEEIEFGSGSSVGNHFGFHKNQSGLTVNQEGYYLIYLKLSFKGTVTEHNTSSTVKVTLKSKDRELLTCEVKLMHGVKEKCLTVERLESQSQITGEMSVHGPDSGWKLVANESGFGIFLVD